MVCSKGSKFILLHMDISCPSIIYYKTVLSHWPWHPCWKSTDHKWGISILFIDLSAHPHSNTTVLILLFGRRFWNQQVWVLQFYTSSSRMIWLIWVLCISTRILGSACPSAKKWELEFWEGSHWICRLM